MQNRIADKNSWSRDAQLSIERAKRGIDFVRVMIRIGFPQTQEAIDIVSRAGSVYDECKRRNTGGT